MYENILLNENSFKFQFSWISCSRRFLTYISFASSLRKLCFRDISDSQSIIQNGLKLMPDLWFYGISNFLKKGRGISYFRKIRAIVLKLHTNILHPSRKFGIEFGQNRLKRSNFFRFWIFWEFLQNCLTPTNFDLSSWYFVGKFTNTEWCLIPNFIRIGEDL